MHTWGSKPATMVRSSSLANSLRHVLCVAFVGLAVGGCDSCKKKDSASTATPAANSTAKHAKVGAKPLGSASEDDDGDVVPPSGNPAYVADLGFRPAVDGFGFENFGSEPAHPTLGLAELRTMFGDAAACESVVDGFCEANPAASEWLEEANKGLEGGHCEGFSVASLRLFRKKEAVSLFGATSAFEIKRGDKVDRYLATWAASQFAEPVMSEATLKGTPNVILDALIAEYSKKDADPYTFGIYKRSGEGGHAIVPYAIEKKSESIYWVHIYENNDPGIDRYIIFDRTKNTWKYEFAATTPSEPAEIYDGDATSATIDLTHLSARDKLTCPYCKPAEGADSKLQLMGVGKGRLLVTDGKGRKVGWEDGKFLKEIPNAFHPFRGKAWGHTPLFLLPRGESYEIRVDGSTAGETPQDLAAFGGGLSAVITGFKLSSAEHDVMTIDPTGHTIRFKPSAPETPTLRFALDGADVDYLFRIDGLDLDAEENIEVSIDEAKGVFSLHDPSGKPDKYDLTVLRADKKGKATFRHKNIDIKPGDTELIRFGSWSGDKKALSIGVDHGSNGSVDESLELADED